MATLLDELTLYVRQTFHEISPQMYLAPEFELGRPLNLPEEPQEGEPAANPDGHKVVYVNEVFDDGRGQKFRVIDVIGNGTFSYVFKCELVSRPCQLVALKIIKNLRAYRQTGLSEIAIHQRMSAAPDHPGKQHVILPLTTFEIDKHVCLVMPLYQRSLFEGICQTQSLTKLLDTVRRVMRQLLQALEFIHSLGITHCDLKPDNVLFTDDECENIVLIDFGSATVQASCAGQYLQSRFYRSPEIILGLPFDSGIDIWSAGCVAAELFLDFAIFAADNESDTIHSMVGLLGPIPERILAKSPRWQSFFDMKRNGFQPKMDPATVLLTQNCYHQIYEQIGAHPLDRLVQEHCEVKGEEQQAMVTCFNDFLKRLLNYDPAERLTATQALAHPFIEGSALPENWKPPRVKRTDIHSSHPESSTPPAPRMRSSFGDISKNDFLSLM